MFRRTRGSPLESSPLVSLQHHGSWAPCFCASRPRPQLRRIDSSSSETSFDQSSCISCLLVGLPTSSRSYSRSADDLVASKPESWTVSLDMRLATKATIHRHLRSAHFWKSNLGNDSRRLRMRHVRKFEGLVRRSVHCAPCGRPLDAPTALRPFRLPSLVSFSQKIMVICYSPKPFE
jgi:hypothetical protein